MERYAFYLVGAYGAFAIAVAIEIALVRARLARARSQWRSRAEGTPR
jgi:heme exporter protein CcmD